jgi:hypothetical protein
VRIGDHAGDAFQHAGHVGAHRNEPAIAEARGQPGLAGHQQQVLMMQHRRDRPDRQAVAGVEGFDAGRAHAAQPAVGIAEQQLAIGIQRQ